MQPFHDLSLTPATFRSVAAGIGFTEGPARSGTSDVLVTSMTRGLVYRVALSGDGAEEFAETGGGPNGLAVGTEGDLLVMQSGATVMPTRSAVPAQPGIQRIAADGTVSTVTTDVHSPSDGVLGPDGRLWFTDPSAHDLDSPTGTGAVRALDLSTGVMADVITGLAFPNGLAFAADGTRLLVAETGARWIRRYDLSGGAATPDGWIARMPEGHPDGLALDALGRVWVAGSTGANIVVFGADGTVAGTIDFPVGHMVTSLCFAGEDLRTLVVTMPKGGQVLAAPVDCPGLPLPVMR
ncbi:SMP-30/gluconolactonase/LRE family protein [Micromonospora sp. NPDC049048]|uniref:SMP-30/gluconolactonase/LRE family protein n=1 Tax=Micromonospora sp. NPDC049048 TaxID=3364263 RepID=UPI003717548A